MFVPPSVQRAEQTQPEVPPLGRTGRPGDVAPLSVVVADLLLAESEHGQIFIDYLDAYSTGFELKIRATAIGSYRSFARDGDPGPDVFGRHWPTADEPRDKLPSQLLRVGVRFADGRAATNISGHDSPVDGPSLWALQGGGHGGRDSCAFDQGYWIAPLPAGPVSISCEWPIAGIEVSRLDIQGETVLEAAQRVDRETGEA
jgi:hypothetical protein